MTLLQYSAAGQNDVQASLVIVQCTVKRLAMWALERILRSMSFLMQPPQSPLMTSLKKTILWIYSLVNDFAQSAGRDLAKSYSVYDIIFDNNTIT